MISYRRSAVVSIISFLVVVGFTAPATAYAQFFGGYGGGGGGFFFPSGPNTPHQELIVTTWGPTSPTQGYMQPNYANPNYYAYNQPFSAQSVMPFAPQYQYGNPKFEDINAKFWNYTVISPQTYQYAAPATSFSGGYGYPGQMNPGYSYGYPSYGSSYGYGGYGYGAPSTGLQDFWGNDLCYWGPGYNNLPCDRDPHQWIQDPYTGTWY